MKRYLVILQAGEEFAVFEVTAKKEDKKLMYRPQNLSTPTKELVITKVKGTRTI